MRRRASRRSSKSVRRDGRPKRTHSLAGHTNSYHTYGLDEGLAGNAQAGFRGVELSAVPGWMEHVPLDGPSSPVKSECALRLTAVSGEGVWNFPALGAGTVDFASVLAILRDAGYAGPCSVELEFRGEPWPPLEEVTDAMCRSCAHLRHLCLS